MPTCDQEDLLQRHLRALLGDIAPATEALLRQQLEWVALGGGDTLMTQGEPGDSMYLVISGRLRAYAQADDGTEQLLREMGRGQVIGEMSLYTDAPRSATVVAIRESVLVRLGKAAFLTLLGSSAQLSMTLTRQLIERLQGPPAGPARPVAIALLPVSADVDVAALGQLLAAELGRQLRVCQVDAARIDRDCAQPGLAEDAGAEADTRIGQHLDALEAAHDVVLLLANAQAGPWTRRCSRRCDEMLLLAQASQPAQLHPIESQILMQRQARAEARETLVLLHPAEQRSPRGTRQWLQRRPVDGHLHIRPALARDIARLARFMSGTAVGLVLAGGGARGLAHLGIYRALQEHGIEVDCVGGTSIGSVMAALVAMDRPLPELMTVARQSFGSNPTGDFNLLPMLSLIAGRRMRRVLDQSVQALMGHAGDIEDLWKTYFCVASNYSQAREQCLTQGELTRAIRASSAIPGALPPVLIDGDLLCDGGTFANFPVDRMRALHGVGRVIGVDLASRKYKPIALDEVPGSWALWRDRWRPWARRRFRLPSLMAYLMNVTILYSSSRQHQARARTDLYFNPPLERVGMLQWKRFDDIVAQGHAHGLSVLAALPERTRAFFGATP